MPAAVITALLFAGLVAGPLAHARVIAVAPGELTSALVASAAGDTLQLDSGNYHGPLHIRHNLRLIGRGDSVIEGDGKGSVITIDATDVELSGLVVRGSGLSLATEDSGIFITSAGSRANIHHNHLHNNLIGVNLKGPENAVVANNLIEGRRDLRVNERGNGAQLWNTPGSQVVNNRFRYGRDGIFVTTSRNNLFAGNHFSELRFAVHYMYTNLSTVRDNVSSGNTVGFALMYSKMLTVTGNQSLGDSDRGIFFNFTNDSSITHNVVSSDGGRPGAQKCVFVYNSNFNTLASNRFEACDIGIHFTAGSEQNRIRENSFVGNRHQVKYVGTRNLEWSANGRGNYWSDHAGIDLDGDGIGNRPYRPNSIADQLLWRYPLARLLMNSPVMQLLAWAQSQFPALHPGGVVDSHPLMQDSAP